MSENKRITTDVMKLMMNDFKVELVNEDDMHEFHIQLHGPEDTIYHGYKWTLRVQISADYPYVPPFTHFVDTIFHPNIDEMTGCICLNVLEEAWSAMGDLVAVFEIYIPQLLKYPNPNDPQNRDAAALLLADPHTYEARVREYCERYATPIEPPREESDETEEETSDSEGQLLASTDKMGTLAIQETKDDTASGDEKGDSEADNP